VAAARPPELFHTREQFSADLAPFTKWNKVVARADRQARDPASFCATYAPADVCAADRWAALVALLAALPLRERVERVNAALNGVPYVSAAANWNDPDHWETPFEFLAKGGQCEDYAIAKIMALAATGVPEEALRLVVVRDERLSLDHAVAVVYVDGEALVLDNQLGDVMPAARIGWYVPYYSINRTGWWRHQRRDVWIDDLAAARLPNALNQR
jgi:predicted transglutaminase-like cysteine proteinase